MSGRGVLVALILTATAAFVVGAAVSARGLQPPSASVEATQPRP